jgi:hypothetical protein
MTIYATFLDSKTGAARTPQSSTNCFVIDKDTENFEIIETSSHSTTGGVTTLIVLATYGRALPVYGGGQGSATGKAHAIGAEIGCVDIHNPVEHLNLIMAGTNSTSARSFRVGDGTANQIKLYAETDAVLKPYLLYDPTTAAWYYANDGASENPMAGSAALVAGDGLDLVAGTISLDIQADCGLVITATELDLNVRANYGLLADANGLYIDIMANSGLQFTGGQLDTLLDPAGGISKGAAGLAIGSSSSALSRSQDYEADEAITAGNAVALLPYHCKYYAPMVDTDAALGSTNQLRKYAVKFTPRQGATGLTTIYFRGRDAAASTYTLTATVETDNAGSPSGTPITNGSTTLDVTAWATTYATRTLTFGGGGMTLVADTTYWLVLSVPTTQAANYINIGCATTYIGNYPTFERKTYDVDAGTWGAASAAAIPFFWFALNDTIGHVLVKTDANYHSKTFNFVGIAQENGVAGGTVTVDIQYGTTTGLEPMRDYFLSDTAGAIALTAGTIPYVIGKGLNATTLEIKPGRKCIATKYTHTHAGVDNYVEDLVMTGFRIGKIEGIYGEGNYAHAVANISPVLTGTDLSFFFYEGFGAGPSPYENGAGDTMLDSTSPAIGQFTNPAGDTLICTITNISEMCFSFRFTDADGCSSNVATISYMAEA